MRQGRSKDLTGKQFGRLSAIRPTGERNRRDIVWLCKCECGKYVELTATRLIRENTLSCGCLKIEKLQKANQYIGHTNIRQVMEESVESKRAASGYTGVCKKHGKWTAYITYQGKRYWLGSYTDIEDAVSARAKAKQWVKEDAKRLLQHYGTE